MKKSNIITGCFITLMALSILISSCALNKTKKGALIGTGGGAVIGAVIGRASGNTALGALIGATVGGATGAIIGNKMDKQAEEIKKTVPGAKVYRVGEGIVVEFSDKILFEINQSGLNNSSAQNLNKLISVLGKYPETNIEIQGHTDNSGSDAYNMKLSKKRAASVASFLQTNGIGSYRISTKGYGETAPNYSNDSEDTRAQNRRVEFLITANEQMRKDAAKESSN